MLSSETRGLSKNKAFENWGAVLPAQFTYGVLTYGVLTHDALPYGVVLMAYGAWEAQKSFVDSQLPLS